MAIITMTNQKCANILENQELEHKAAPWEKSCAGVVSLLDMLAYAADVFCVLTEVMGRIIGQPALGIATALRNQGYMQEIQTRLVAARELCIRHKWVETANRIFEFETYLSTGEPMSGFINAAVLQSKCADLESHVFRVLGEELFFHADHDRSVEYLDWSTSSAAWRESFPFASFELSSAGECYLFNQPTAAVFHSMRALEIGLTALAGALGVKTARDQWEVVINNIEAAIKGISGPHAGSDWRQKQEQYSEAALHFRYLKNAWRNHTMHARANYNLLKAKEIWHHSTDFIADLNRTLGLKEPLANALAQQLKETEESDS